MRQSTVQYCNVAPKSDTQTAKNTPNDVQKLCILSVASWRFSKIRNVAEISPPPTYRRSEFLVPVSAFLLVRNFIVCT